MCSQLSNDADSLQRQLCATEVHTFGNRQQSSMKYERYVLHTQT